jgi:hypothetical protein
MEMWLPCSVSAGQFPTEVAVSGTQHNGKPFSLFAPNEMVSATAEPSKGLLRVELVDRKGGLALVRLPAQTFENGQFVTVNADELQPGTHNQKVAP